MSPERLLNERETPGPEHYRILAMAWAGWVFDFYDLILYSFLLIPLGRELALTRLELSWVFGLSLAATALGGVVFGILADRCGRRRVLQWTILTFSAGTFLSGLAPGFGWLLAFRVLTGIGVGGEWATGQTYIAETFPARVRGRYGAYMQTGAPVGVALASVVGGLVAPTLGWRACFLISGLPALLVVFIRRNLPESDVWLRRGGTAPSSDRGRFLELFSRKRRRLFLRCLVLTIFAMSAYWFTYSWLPGYLNEERHFSMAKSTLWILVTQVGGFLGYASFGFVADRWGRRPAFTAYSLAFAVGLTMITVLWTSIAAYPAFVLACMFVVGLGTGVWSGFGPFFSELFPTEIRSTAMGAAYNIARGVQIAAPVAVALLARVWGLGGGMFLAALFSVGTALWVWTLPETKGRTLA